MFLILKTKCTLSLTIVPAQVRINNYWNSSQIGLKFMSLPVNNAVYQANLVYAMHTYY
jgi:hypothetical protein